jgi:hypothetical protein
MNKSKREKRITKNINPFKYSLSDFLKLPDKEKDRVVAIANRMNSDYVNRYFENHPDKDWIIIANRPKKIIRSGIGKDEPYEEDLLEMAKENGTLIFSYSRPRIIEEELYPLVRNSTTTAGAPFFDQVAYT